MMGERSGGEMVPFAVVIILPGLGVDPTYTLLGFTVERRR